MLERRLGSRRGIGHGDRGGRADGRCVFTNTLVTTLTIAQQTIPDHTVLPPDQQKVFSYRIGPPAAEPSDGGTLIAHVADDEEETHEIAVGTYDLRQVAVPGWQVTSIDCGDDSTLIRLDERRVRIVLPPGEAVRCTFTNSNDPWDPLVESAIRALSAAAGTGSLATLAYYDQVKWILCHAGLSPRSGCDPMRPHYSGLLGDGRPRLRRASRTRGLLGLQRLQLVPVRRAGSRGSASAPSPAAEAVRITGYAEDFKFALCMLAGRYVAPPVAIFGAVALSWACRRVAESIAE